MSQVYHYLTIAHVVIGAVSLLVFWVPVVARKGSPWHRRAGRWFAWAMYSVTGSALLMALMLLLDPLSVRFPGLVMGPEDAAQRSADARVAGAFLLLLAVLVFASVRRGMFVLAVRRGERRLNDPAHRGLALLLGGMGLLGVAVGLRQGLVLFVIFGGISVLSAARALRFSIRQSVLPRDFVIEHLSGMLAAGIGAYTAFFAFGGRHLLAGVLTGGWQLLPWILPTVVGSVAISLLTRRYRQQPGARPKHLPREPAALGGGS